jgi:hypothetical protein
LSLAEREGVLRLDRAALLRAPPPPFVREAPLRDERAAVPPLPRAPSLSEERAPPPPLPREAPLPEEREAPLRLVRVPPLWPRPLASVFERAAFAGPPFVELLLLFALRDVAFVAIPHPSQSRIFPASGTPRCIRNNPNCRVLAETSG